MFDVSARAILNYGKYYRIWPHVDVSRNDLYVSVGLARPFVKPLCKLLVSRDYGKSWKEIADFHSADKRNTTTGQPFVANEGSIFVPVWSAGFYTHGNMWIAIYKGEEYGTSWKKVYEDAGGTYGKHFFQSSTDETLYIGVGVGGGGSNGRISSTPAKSYLLKSTDAGRTWRKVLKVDHPTSLYSGVAFDDTILVAARERKSVFRSVDGGKSWTETSVGKSARNISYIQELGKFVITSDSCIFVSKDGLTWVRLNSRMKGLILRYPLLYKGRIYMTGVGGRSCVISTDLTKWYITFDATEVTGSNLFARMALVDDYVFLGNEMNGVLLRAKLPTDNNRLVDTLQVLKCYFKYLVWMWKSKIEGVNGHKKV